MSDRLQLHSINSQADLIKLMSAVATELLSNRDPSFQPDTHRTLFDACGYVCQAGAKTVVIQYRVQDPDFLAEHSAYYSRQFVNVSRHCARAHFFSASVSSADVLAFLDSEEARDTFLGFITLRPIPRAPVGASILAAQGANGFVKSIDVFPVHIAGVKFEVRGTPFLQQDNAVGACAQASIWMALRTLRKREGDRAYDPAQITGAATRYFINGRTLPNRTGLTQYQIVEAVRAAGYSPHFMSFGQQNGGVVSLTKDQANVALYWLHPYIESKIPAILILFPKSGGHAVVAIGHTWEDVPTNPLSFNFPLANNVSVDVQLAASWTPSLLVHNDNSGPYRELALTNANPDEYCLSQALAAIPLLPADVFMTGEEAQQVGMDVISQVLLNLQTELGDAEVQKVAGLLTVRLLLVEKRGLRSWAVSTTGIPPELQQWLRMQDLPRRIWVLELHLKAVYPSHGKARVDSLVGLVLMDPTGDAASTSVLLMYFNFPTFTTLADGVMTYFDPVLVAKKTSACGPLSLID